ncbi:aminotransferase [Lipomyces japonicus]|uniref:aminotransferase n=1 Tax=Lipomyces japonicus TaxID=56871 RepID=UPI0034CFC3F4
MVELDPNFAVTSAIRYDPTLSSSSSSSFDSLKRNLDPSVFFLFPRHVARLNTAHDYYWPELAHDNSSTVTATDLLPELYHVVARDPAKHWRLRTLVHKQGEITVEGNIVPPRGDDLFSGLRAHASAQDPHAWVVYIDTKATPQSIFTAHKTTVRDPYSAARDRVLPKDTPISAKIEVLLYNANDQFTEGSLTNVAFFRNNEWVTPSSSTVGGLRGSVRAELLDRGIIKEVDHDQAVLKQSVKEGEKVLLFNGIQGVVAGFVRLGPYRDES